MVEHNIVHPVQILNGMYANSHFLFKIDKDHTGGSCKIRFNEHGSSSPKFRGDLKISDQNHWGSLSKKLILGAAKFKGGPKILGGGYELQ